MDLSRRSMRGGSRTNPVYVSAVALFAVLFAANTQAANKNFRFPAEFEPQQAVWMAWPTYENKVGMPSEPVLLDIIEIVKGDVRVELLVEDKAEEDEVRGLLAKRAGSDHVHFHHLPHSDIWIRDMGPIFVVNDAGEMAVVDFNFNVWGYEDPNSEGSKAEEVIDREIAKRLGLPTIKSQIISEGGNREVNGNGTMIVCSAVELQRNPGMTLEQIGAELKRVLGQKQIIWIPEGMAEDELTFKGKLPGDVFTVITTGGHVDEFVRFADEKTILLAEIDEEEAARDPISAISRPRLEKAREILEAARDTDGKPFKIVRVPSPDSLFTTMSAGDGVFDYIQPLEYEDGTVIKKDDTIKVIAAASYLNYVMTNKHVIVQTYWKPGRPESMKKKDEKALQILRKVFKNRKVVTINGEPVNFGGGGIHCITQQMPAIKSSGKE